MSTRSESIAHYSIIPHFTDIIESMLEIGKWVRSKLILPFELKSVKVWTAFWSPHINKRYEGSILPINHFYPIDGHVYSYEVSYLLTARLPEKYSSILITDHSE